MENKELQLLNLSSEISNEIENDSDRNEMPEWKETLNNYIKQTLNEEGGIDVLGNTIKFVENEIDTYKSNIDYLKRKIEGCERKIEWYKNEIKKNLQDTGEAFVKSDLYKFSLYESVTHTVNKEKLDSIEQRILSDLRLPEYLSVSIKANYSKYEKASDKESDLFTEEKKDAVKFLSPKKR